MSDNRDVGVSPSETVSGTPENVHGPDRLVVDSLRRGRSEPYSRRRVVETFEKECGLAQGSLVAMINVFNPLVPTQEMVKKIAKRHGVDSKKILFVDDSYHNYEDVVYYTDATALLLGYHIDNLDELLEFIK